METAQPSGNSVPRTDVEPGSPAARPPLPPRPVSRPRAVSRPRPATRSRQGVPAPAPVRDDLSRPPGWGDPGPPAGPDRAKPRVRVSSPADVLAVVPHLLGFHPELSFVVIGAAGPRRQVELGFRYDLPDPPDAAVAAEIADHAVSVLTERRMSTVIGVGYGPGRLVTPVADALAPAVRRSRLHLRELLRVENGRYWSYLCANVNCCPADGTPFD